MLGARDVATQSECQWVENLYRDKVMSVARKMAARQQARDLVRQQMESVSYMLASGCHSATSYMSASGCHNATSYMSALGCHSATSYMSASGCHSATSYCV